MKGSWVGGASVTVILDFCGGEGVVEVFAGHTQLGGDSLKGSHIVSGPGTYLDRPGGTRLGRKSDV